MPATLCSGASSIDVQLAAAGLTGLLLPAVAWVGLLAARSLVLLTYARGRTHEPPLPGQPAGVACRWRVVVIRTQPRRVRATGHRSAWTP